jgi:predicted phosphohydrolase
MKLAWLTDIHLNFINDIARQNFYQKIVDTQCDGVLISGDIAEAPSVESMLREMASCIQKPIYFVLGNHDYYRGQINEVRNAMSALTESNKNLFWLPVSGIQELDQDTFLVGQDGWADGRYGDYANSTVVLNDSRMISELFQEKMLGRYQLLEKMQQLADADALSLKEDLIKAVSKNPKKILVLTHVPPFKEACLHMGKMSDENWLPYFSSKAIGDVLVDIAGQHPTIDFLVFCGHTHSEAKYQSIGNLVVEAGKAEYYRPEIQKIIMV